MARAKVNPQFKKPRPRNFFREWRKFRGHTQAELAEMIGVAVATISQLETGRVGFSDVTLQALADALHCNPGELLMRNPLDEEAPWSIWDHIPKEKRADAVRLLQVLAVDPKRTGTDG